MRITFFHSDFTEIGGAEILLTAQARWLMAAGHSVRIVALRADGTRWREVTAGVSVEVVGLPRGIPKVEFLTAPLMPALAARARPFLDGADVVVAYNYPTAALTADASDARRVWYACEPYRSLYLRAGNPEAAAHAERAGRSAADLATRQVARRLLRERLRRSVLPWTARRDDALRAWDGAGVRRLEQVASLSPFSASCVRQATGRDVVAVIPPMVQFPTAPVVRRGLNRSAPQILAQTRLGIPKNIDTLVRGFARFRRAFPHALLHVIGDGVRRADFERIASREAPDGVRFHGFLPAAEAEAIAAQCDVFALLPVDEPFGMVFPEAAARGLLLVGSDHGGPREILQAGALGEVCDPFSPDAIAEALERTFGMTDAQADARRLAADASCRLRYGADTVGQQLAAWLQG